MKKFFILLMVVLMLAGLTFSSFAVKQQGEGNGDCDQKRDGSCLDSSLLAGDDCTNPNCPNPDGCVPVGDEHKWGKLS